MQFTMKDNLEIIQYRLVHKYNYRILFQEVQPNGRTLTDSERVEFVSIIDESIKQYSEGLPLMHETLAADVNLSDDYHEVEKAVVSIWLFVLITMIDCLVASKYFIIAKRDYDRRFMRGKLKVILNEGFKRLYGFGTKAKTKPEWRKLEPLMTYFPDIIKEQYRELTNLLETHAKTSSWWKEERDLETHIFDAARLYESRMEEVYESQVMMDSLKLFNSLQAVSQFVGNAHTCLNNYLVGKYKRGEIKE